MYDAILIPTDGSNAAEKAMPHAIDLARTYDATLHVLYVVDTEAINLSLGTEQVDRIIEGRFGEMIELKNQATQAIQRVADAAGARDVQVVKSVTAGLPYKQILTYAEDHDIELIVMSSHGRTGVRRMLLGSVTEKVIRLAEIPVLVIRVGTSKA